MAEKTAEVRSFWSSFQQASGVGHEDYDVVSFGDSPAMADELADLVLAGIKRATAGLLRDFEPGREPMPKAGGHAVLVDGRGRPRCVWRTTEVEVRPLGDVDAAFASDEGEGDRTLASWLQGHRAYFMRQAAREGFAFHDRLPTVLERFVVVWPNSSAG